eukprot:gene9689-10679_t
MADLPGKENKEPERESAKRNAFQRGLSMASDELVAHVRQQIESCEKSTGYESFDSFDETPNCSFILPNITELRDNKLINFLKNDLIDKNTYAALTKTDVLNWWAEAGLCRKLFPMRTVGDGNCLLHAVSLGMWGINDRNLTLRKALHRALKSSLANGTLKRRWMYQQWLLNMEVGGLSFSKDEWETEWQEIVRLASERPRIRGQDQPTRKISMQYSRARTDSVRHKESQAVPANLESLEEFHVFVLAQVLRRPIIVLADTMLRDVNGEAVQPINFSGIYLPIECAAKQCYKYPLILGYDSAHFAALVPAAGEDVSSDQQKLSSSVLLVRKSLEHLPIQFLRDPGHAWIATEHDSDKVKLAEFTSKNRHDVLLKYLKLVKLNVPDDASDHNNCTTGNSDIGDGGNRGVIRKDDKPRVSSALMQFGKMSISTLVTRPVNQFKDRIKSWSSSENVYAAELDLHSKPKHYDDMVSNYIEKAKQKLAESDSEERRETQLPGKTQLYKEAESRVETQPEALSLCITHNCQFYGSEKTNYLCSACYKRQQKYYASNQDLQSSLPPVTEENSSTTLLAKLQHSQSSPLPIGSADANVQPSLFVAPKDGGRERASREEDLMTFDDTSSCPDNVSKMNKNLLW